MQRNTDHIQTTHIGSMIRPPEVLELLVVKEAGEPYDVADWDARLDTAVRSLVQRQVELGLDLVSDGEMSKNSFSATTCRRKRRSNPLKASESLYWNGSARNFTVTRPLPLKVN